MLKCRNFEEVILHMEHGSKMPLYMGDFTDYCHTLQTANNYPTGLKRNSAN